MNQRQLGRTNLTVTELGLGGVFVGKRSDTHRHEGISVVHRALGLDVTYIDTAPAYSGS